MSSKPNITLKKDIHRKQNVIRIEFEYNSKLNYLLKTATHAKWSRTRNCWYLVEDNFEMNPFFKIFKNHVYIDYSALRRSFEIVNQKSKDNDYSFRSQTELPKGYREILKQKRYSENTIRSYTAYFKDFVHYFRD